MHRDLAQRLATAGAGHAFAALQLETRAVHRAYQQTVLAAQELPGRPIESTPRMRADVEPCAHDTGGIAMHDQRFRIAVHHGFDLMQAVDGDRVEPQQDRNIAAITV